MLAEKGRARSEDPLERTSKVTDQDVDMHDRAAGTAPGRATSPAPGRALERKPLAVRRRLQRDPARIPPDRSPAQQPCPEPGQTPRISAVQHMMNDTSNLHRAHAQTSFAKITTRPWSEKDLVF
jgi:hypothetical protein